VFSSRRRHTRSKRDWSSDVCSSDLTAIHKTVLSRIVEGQSSSGLAPSTTETNHKIAGAARSWIAEAQSTIAGQGQNSSGLGQSRSGERRGGKGGGWSVERGDEGITD